MSRDWYDTIPGAYARNVGRIVGGVVLDIGDNEQGIREQTVTIERIIDVSVGIDSSGIFACLKVRDTDGGEWTLYVDGSVSDVEDQTVGRHTLTCAPQTNGAAA